MVWLYIYAEDRSGETLIKSLLFVVAVVVLLPLVLRMTTSLPLAGSAGNQGQPMPPGALLVLTDRKAKSAQSFRRGESRYFTKDALWMYLALASTASHWVSFFS
jgi:hypothetical protein